MEEDDNGEEREQNRCRGEEETEICMGSEKRIDEWKEKRKGEKTTGGGGAEDETVCGR